MPLAGNVTLITVNGAFVDYAGVAIAGQVKFTMNSVLRNQIADQIVIPSVVTITLDTNGAFTTQLPATNDPDLSATFTYSVEEAFSGGRSYTISLPEGVGTVDLTDLAPASTFSVFTAHAPKWQWNILNAQVQSMDNSVDQATGSINFFNPTYQNIIVKTYATINANFATYAVLKAGPVSVIAAELSGYGTSAQASATAAQGSATAAASSLTSTNAQRDAALASQATSEAQLALIVAENDSCLDLTLFGA